MNQLDRIEHELASQNLDHREFERCSQDLLTEVFPGLVPIPGGTDWGRDADIPAGAEPPIRLLATTSRNLAGIRANMLEGLRSMTRHGLAFDRIVLANPGQLNQQQRQGLADSARKDGARLETVYDRTFFASRLRRDGHWRARLLGLSADPISLSHLPTDLAESPWAKLPLVGREEDLRSLSDLEHDLILTGPPGVGKTRLLAERGGVVFVDKDAALGQVADDLRWSQPAVVVVDDAAEAEALIRELVRLRQVESDLARYQMVAVCWPDEVDGIRDWLRGAQIRELELVERQHLDRLLVEMGITGNLARAEILDQAEGRPGWAVSLADTLLRAGDTQSLLRGRALLGEVERYLRRANVGGGAIDLLALVAAVGGVEEAEIAHVAADLQLTRPQAVQLLTGAARSGLLDVVVEHRFRRGSTRSYTVRPPMLARVLVAERAFAAAVPGVDFDALAESWPDRLFNLARAAIDGVLLGVEAARTKADALFEAAIASEDVSAEEKIELVKSFARIDKTAADRVVDLLRANLEALDPSDELVALRAESLIDVAYQVARWHQLDSAVVLMLDAALLDNRPTNPNPGHPIRKIADLAGEFHPELPLPNAHRSLLARVANAWLGSEPSDARWQVYGHAIQATISLHMRSAMTAPGDPRRLELIETVVPPKEVRRIYEELWPAIKERLASAPPAVIGEAIESAHDWLRIGGGHDQPFGQAHPESSIVAAKEFGERLLKDLMALVGSHPGLVMSLRNVASNYEIQLDLGIDEESEIFLRDLDLAEDWEAEMKRLRSDIADVLSKWPRNHAEVAKRLVVLREQLQVANVTWPDRIGIACDVLAADAQDRLSWADAFLEAGLFPEAAPFLGYEISSGGQLGNKRLQRLMDDSRARWACMFSVLTVPEAHTDDVDLVLRSLVPGDYRMLKDAAFRPELSEERKRALLTRPSEPARAAAAAAIFYRGKAEPDGWDPTTLEAEWIAAIGFLDPDAMPGFQDYEAGELTEYLAKRYSEVLTRWVSSRLEAADDGFYRALPHAVWERLHLLPHAAKDDLWKLSETRPAVKWMLGRELVGTDTDWLRHAIEEGLMSPQQALDSYNSLGAHLPIAEMARLLIPRGIEARRVAYLAQGGTWVGEESARYSALVEEFEEMAKSGDDSVAAVGRAGIEMFSSARDDALSEERRRNIRGEL